MKRIAVWLIALTVSFGCLVGCNNTGGGGGNDDEKKYGDRPIKITFSYYNGGFGDDHWKALSRDFMDNVNTDVYIELRKEYDNTVSRSNILADTGISDLYQLETGMFRLPNALEEITDVYDMTVFGEDKKVKDKMPKYAYDCYNEGGKFYQFSINRMTGWNWVANRKVLRTTLGSDWDGRMPRTTDEFLSLGKTLYDKGVFLTAGALADVQGGDYLPYAFQGWFAQMLGKEATDKFYDGYTKSGDDWVFCRDNPQLIRDNAAAIESVYKLAEDLLKSGTSVQMLHKDSKSMAYKDLDKVFYGGKFKRQDVPRFAFAYIGEWLEREAEVFFEEGSLTDRDQDIVAVKMPVISDIISRTASINSEDKLRETVDYVDGARSDKPEGVTDEDIAVIREARGVVVENMCNQLVIPKNAKNKDVSKQFMAYLCSDRAQKLAAQNASGTAMLPFGYDPTDEDMGFTISDYVKSVRAVADPANVWLVDSARSYSAFTAATNISWYYDNKKPSHAISKDIHGSDANSMYTPHDQIAEMTYNHYNLSWSQLMTTYDSLVK